MRVEQEKVALFMEKIGEEIHYLPQLVSDEAVRRRAKFIVEEAEEYRDAALTGDLVKVADAIGDLLYVVLGAAVLHGIDIKPVFDEVHLSNMTKFPVNGPDKLCKKGLDFQPPRLAAILLRQSTKLDFVE